LISETVGLDRSPPYSRRMDIVLFFALAIAYALICRWIAEFANSKGYSYWAFALFSLFATPIWSARGRTEHRRGTRPPKDSTRMARAGQCDCESSISHTN
jgi:hypothetical protein